MTAYCGGGTSGPIAGVPQFVASGAAAIESALILRGLGKEAALLAPILARLTFDVDDFCAADPPADPGITPQDIFNAVQLAVPSVSIPAILKVSQWWSRQMWFQFCECKTVPTPPPAAPSLPGPGVGTDTNLPPGLSNQPCWSADNTGVEAFHPGSGPAGTDLTQEILPPNPSFFHGGSITTPDTHPVLIPPGVTNITWASTIDRPNPTTAGVDFTMRFFRADQSVIISADLGSFINTRPPPQSGSVTLPSGAAYWSVERTNSAETQPPFSMSLHFQFFCSGAPPNTVLTPCCPPDPLVNNYLSNIFNIVLQIQQNNQASAPAQPVSWKDGVRHTGLREAGSFVIDQTSLAVRLEVTRPPTSPRILPGNPDFYWDMGFITPIALTSPLRGARLVFLKQTITLPEFTDSVGYTLLDGTVADAIELLPVFPT